MMRPIGLYLTEFRPGMPSALLSDVSDTEEPDPFAIDLPFGADEDGLSFGTEAPSDLSEPEPEPDDPAILPETVAPIDMSATIEALQAEHAAALAEARQHWAEQEGVALATLIASKFAELETRLAEALAPLLEPFLSKATQIKMLDQLRGSLDTLLSGHPPQGAIMVSGPDDLIEAIRQAYPGQPALAFEAAHAPDVTITMGDTRIRSQLRSWARKLDTALGAR
ncbi:hypothetical protein [Lichenifustis flavocetrariae]|uniref:Uncharacterized protein n=1 Tax=Lichenifustis flavocetrariae TaxID=2949735 RepID=A0AA42CJW4_9HYPH|nr:hypothetical protein [Lichenifustis flavocetrariae]MCW6508536.1 hypothetical protein [Lichenifustis flavocetrariae]